jgi:hypothetical protein
VGALDPPGQAQAEGQDGHAEDRARRPHQDRGPDMASCCGPPWGDMYVSNRIRCRRRRWLDVRLDDRPLLVALADVLGVRGRCVRVRVELLNCLALVGLQGAAPISPGSSAPDRAVG